MGQEKINFESNRLAIKTCISDAETKNCELEKNLKFMKETYEARIRKLKEESAYKMKVFHETAEERISNYLKRTNENFKQFAEQLSNSVRNYLENVRTKATLYNESVEKRVDGFIDRRVLENVKGNLKVKGLNNTTVISSGSTNNTMISNGNNSILK